MGFVEDVHRGRVAASHASRLASTEVGHRYISHLRATPPDFIYLVGAHGSKSNKKKPLTQPRPVYSPCPSSSLVLFSFLFFFPTWPLFFSWVDWIPSLLSNRCRKVPGTRTKIYRYPFIHPFSVYRSAQKGFCHGKSIPPTMTIFNRLTVVLAVLLHVSCVLGVPVPFHEVEKAWMEGRSEVCI